MGGAIRIEVALDRIPERADEVALVDQRHHLLGLLGGDDLGLHPDVAPARMRHPEVVHAHFGIGEL
jgi:hypothetical protein